MDGPVLVEVTRGDRVESVHRGAVAIVDSGGRTLAAIGDVELPVYPRSAVKAIQALPLVESGAADAYGFGDRQLALACASHNGEAAHAELAAAMLRAAGLGESDLECGAHPPAYDPARRALYASKGAPSQFHNNCSGKHAGFLCAACHQGWDTKGYVGGEHPVQMEVRAALADVTSHAIDPASAGIDGCSIPTYAIPLERLAFGMARMVTGEGLSPARAAAAARLIAACQSEPFFTAGTDRLCTEAMTRFGKRLYLKTGAEGVFCAALPQAGIGIAVKCDDGAGRASDVVIAALVAALLRLDAGDPFYGRVNRPVLSVRDAAVGMTRPSAVLTALMEKL